MKYKINIILFFISAIIFGQKKGTYKVTFSQTVKFVFEKDSTSFTADEMDALKRAGGKSNMFTLLVNDKESLFTVDEKISNDQAVDGMNFSFSQSEKKRFTNFNDKIYLTEESIPKKLFIRDSLETIEWIILKNESEHLGYKIRKAIAKMDTFYVTAWFAPNIKTKAGPMSYWGLPGLILKLEQESLASGETIEVNAKHIERLLEVKDISPKGFKKRRVVSSKAYSEMIEGFYKKQKELYGGGVDTSN